ncbi:hypothetical protein AALF15_01255 [Corynebacteriaceae bacterium 7-707]
MSEHYEPRDFTAYGPCPRCGDRDLHGFDTAPVHDDDMRAGENHRTEWEPEDTIKAWGGNTLMAIRQRPVHYYRTDQSTCDIVRTCKHCGARWGEK